jgi:phage-related protein
MKVKFYLTYSGRSPVEVFLAEISQDVKDDFVEAVVLLETGQNISTGSFRFFYYIKKLDGIYFVHAFKKKTNELPPTEIAIILKRLKEI